MAEICIILSIWIFRPISKYVLCYDVFDDILYLDSFLNIIYRKEDINLLQDTLKALSDPNRRKILELLKKGPMSAGEIGESFQLTGASLSHHLSVLKKAGLVDDNKQGTFIYYEINTSVMEDILTWIAGFIGEEK